MANDIKVKVEESNGKTTEFKGRLVGFIEDDDECKAILNLEDAARKLSTAESIKAYNRPQIIFDKRFVIVTRELVKDEPHIFISPKIESLSFRDNNHVLKCKDNMSYTLINIP